MNPQTDIIVPVHNALEYLTACVVSVDRHTQNFRYIFVDDYSDRVVSEWLLDRVKERPTSLLVRTGQQKWFTRASNLGLRLVRTERCVLLNSDCVVDDGWLEELYSVWDDAATKIVGRKVGLVGSHLSAEEPRRWGEYIEPGYVTGHCFLLSIPIIAEIAERRGQAGWYLDEMHREAIHINSDRYLSYELNRAGYATVASFKAAVGHHGGKSWGYQLSRMGSLQIGDPLKGEVFG